MEDNRLIHFPQLYNICVLKILAFGLDYHWATLAQKTKNEKDKKEIEEEKEEE